MNDETTYRLARVLHDQAKGSGRTIGWNRLSVIAHESWKKRAVKFKAKLDRYGLILMHTADYFPEPEGEPLTAPETPRENLKDASTTIQSRSSANSRTGTIMLL